MLSRRLRRRRWLSLRPRPVRAMMGTHEAHDREDQTLLPVGSPTELKALPTERLPDVAAWLRSRIIDTVTRNGGHLGSNLGAVELSIALHRVFDSPQDAIIFDTGHQAYAHKLLTGRDDAFDRLRQAGGVHAYPLREESAHDWVENSHASTAISYALGMATARARQAEDGVVVAVVGDGSLTGGLAYEGLNNLGSTDLPVVILLNDNGRSYAPTVSRLSHALAEVRRKAEYRRLKNAALKAAERFPGGKQASAAGWRGLKAALSSSPALQGFVEALGVAYHGPVDGHDIDSVADALRYAASRREPVLVHAITTKGLGYAPAEDDDDKKLHDVAPPEPERRASDEPKRTFGEAFSEAVLTLADRDERVVAISAAMVGSTGLSAMQERYPDRVLDVGIAEQHALTMAAGLGLGGARPVVAVYSTFMARAFDQLNLDAALHDCPLILAMDRAGITGPDGPSHHGVLDLALALRIPGARVLTPSSPQVLYGLLTQLDGRHGPVIVRYPKKADFAPAQADQSDHPPLAMRLADGSDGCLVAFGDRVAAALDARKTLRGHGLDVAVWASHQAKQVPDELLEGMRRYPTVLTVENGVQDGGAGHWLRGELERRADGSAASTPLVRCLGLPTAFIEPDEAAVLLRRYGLDGEGIGRSFLALCNGRAATGHGEVADSSPADA